MDREEEQCNAEFPYLREGFVRTDMACDACGHGWVYLKYSEHDVGRFRREICPACHADKTDHLADMGDTCF